MTAHKLSSEFIHLGLGATAIAQPPFDGMEWYQAYGERYDEADGAEQRLISMYTFTEGWTSWEMHPLGEEVSHLHSRRNDPASGACRWQH